MTAISRVNGESLERALDAYHATLAARGIAWIRRVGTPVTVLGRVAPDKRGRWCFRAAFSGHQGADFVGLDAGGRHICVEAKSHAGPDAWDSGIDPSSGNVGAGGAIDSPQWAELRQTERAGGLALVVLEAWGSAWAMRPHDLRMHVGREKRRTVRASEVADFAGQLVGVDWWATAGLLYLPPGVHAVPFGGSL